MEKNFLLKKKEIIKRLCHELSVNELIGGRFASGDFGY